MAKVLLDRAGWKKPQRVKILDVETDDSKYAFCLDRTCPGFGTYITRWYWAVYA